MPDTRRSTIRCEFRAHLAEKLPDLKQSAPQVVRTLDTYDAARLLLVQDHLMPGESVAAIIPDRDTLVLVPLPRDDDWGPLRVLAGRPVREPLYDRPLRVTFEGVFAPPG